MKAIGDGQTFELEGGVFLTSSGGRRSRRECLVGRPRSPFAEGAENKLLEGVPRRALSCDRPLPGRCRTPSTSSAYERCLSESLPKAERFTPVRRSPPVPDPSSRGGAAETVESQVGGLLFDRPLPGRCCSSPDLRSVVRELGEVRLVPAGRSKEKVGT